MQEKLNIVFSAEQADFSEVTDSIYDLLKVGSKIEAQLKDGFQFTDLIALLNVQGDINEIINDVPVFLEQFMQLEGNTAIQAIDKAAELLASQGLADGVVVRFILAALQQMAQSYAFAERTYIDAQVQINSWKALIGK